MPNCSCNQQQMNTSCDPTSIQETADSLVIIRADVNLAKPFGVDDPFAHLFVTEAGKRMASMAISVDPCYVDFNLVRYRHITERIRDAISRYHQILFLGAGYDTRAISMIEFSDNPVEVFEVDYPEKLAEKQQILKQAGVEIPSYLHFVPMNLSQPGLLHHLRSMGFRSSYPTLVIMEGLLFFLPSETTKRLINPQTLALASGSTVIFDYWSNERIDMLNHRVEEKLGKRLFSSFPYPDHPSQFHNIMIDMGYQDMVISDLDILISEIHPGFRNNHLPDHWFVVQTVYNSNNGKVR
jgi:methyltransferase (TIGR00027 family)